MNKALVLLFTAITATGYAQDAPLNREKIDEAGKQMNAELVAFNNCILNSDADSCISRLVRSARNEYQKYVAGSVLYEIDKEQSFRLNKAAYEAAPGDLNFVLEYAIALHRKGAYAEAAKLYETYAAQQPDDYRVSTWLADCYINTGNIDSSIACWKKADHAKHHTGMENAIYVIYGEAGQVKKRNNLRKAVSKKDVKALYSLIFLDMNWQADWWNRNPQYYFLNEDIALAQKSLGNNNKDVQLMMDYMEVKQLSKSEESKADSIRLILARANIILGNGTLPTNGQVASDLLSICLQSQLVDPKTFFKAHGATILSMAKKYKDAELLNIYANLQASTEGKVDPAIDKMGWKEFKDERFAISYFAGKGADNKYDDPELAEAIKDFPNSSNLLGIKAYCAKQEHKDLHPLLIALIQKEFKTLGGGNDRFSSSLKAYYDYLQSEK